jgi:hypothetical protein
MTRIVLPLAAGMADGLRLAWRFNWRYIGASHE